MENELGVEYEYTKRDDCHRLNPKSIGIIRYADDFVAICHTQEQADSMYVKMTDYLRKRQLSLSIEKTKVMIYRDNKTICTRLK